MSQQKTQMDNDKELSPLQQSYFVIRKLKASLDAMQRQRTEPIAIIGAGCRLPGGANDLEAYWRLLRNGLDAVKEVPPERWDINAFYDPDPTVPGKTNTRCAAFLDQVDHFDPLFFGISPREAISLDPQQRLLLEVSWEALERAGQAPDRLVSERTGVFVGIGQMDYAQLLLRIADPAQIDIYAGTGNGFCFASGRLSYILGLRGPNLAIDTACSSSLVAVHLACQSLRVRECDLALAGGVQLLLSPQAFVGLTKLGALSPDGKCKTFDAAADGYGRGEGCGVVVLKRLSDALADGDVIAALIRGSAVNHDGSSSGFTVPNGLAQQEVLRRALENAGVKPVEVGYIETHGTGTQLGDPIDVEALGEVFCRDRQADSPLIIGSVKTNIGHLEAAAGIAGLLKIVLCLQHREIPPHLHFKRPNPHIRWNQTPIKVVTVPTPWSPKEEKRIAGVSSFGLSGTNAHVVLEEAPPPRARDAFVDRPRHLLPLSAQTPKALAELARRYETYLAAHPETPLGDLCFTSATGRVHRAIRAGIVGASLSEMRERLAALADETREPNAADNGQRPKIAFLFTGQGSQYVAMGRSLYKTQPGFRDTLNCCDEILRPYLDRPLLEVINPEKGIPSPLNETAYTQPALFALEYALAKLWNAWGIEPDLMMGHSVGEYVAACLAGVFSLEDGLKLIAQRARLMQALPADGAMAVVFAGERAVAAAIESEPARVSIAALNGPDNTVISGEREVVDRLLAAFQRDGIRSTRLQVSHAFHSPLMEPMLADFEHVARAVRYHLPQKALLSNLEGKMATAEMAGPAYWVKHVRMPVKFAEGMATLERLGCTLYIEIGPKPALLTMGRRCLPNSSALWLPSLSQGQEDWQPLLQSLARVYEQGGRIDWAAFDSDYDRRRMVLPTYPFQRQRYWLALNGNQLTPAPARANSGSVHPFVGSRLRLPLSRETRFETRFDAASPAYLKDHQLFDTVVVPAASHIGMILCAATEALGAETCVLEDLFFPQALVLDEQSGYTLQTILTPEGDGLAFRIVSLNEQADEESPDAWTVHCLGRVRPGAQEPAPTPASDIEALRADCPRALPASEFYSNFKSAGYGLGPAFRWLESIWQGEGEAMARLQMPALPERIDSYRLYPGLIDSCFQLLAACWRGGAVEAGSDDIYVPFTIEHFHYYRAHIEGDLWCHTRIRKEQFEASGTLIADTRLFDQSGRLIAEIFGFEGRRASRKALLHGLQGSLNDALYELAWQASPATPAVALPIPQAAAVQSSWLIFSDQKKVGAKLIERLKARGDIFILIEAGETFEQLDAQRFRLDPDSPAGFDRLIQALRDGPAPAGIVHLWSLDEAAFEETDAMPCERSQRLGCASVLHLIRALSQSGWSTAPRLYLVTRNAVSVGAEPKPIAIEQSALWGLGRVIALEHPELHCVRVDLDSEADSDEAAALAQELTQPGQEDQIAFRGAQRYVARLLRFAEASLALQNRPAQARDAYKLMIGAAGILDELRLAHLVRRKPGPGEVEIRVRATGLNLRDVLLALGMFNEHLEQLGIKDASEFSFGFECAGEITAVGEGVTRFKPGDAVMGLTLGGMNSHVTVNAALITAKPSELTFEQAATLPLAFASAFLGLNHLARLQPGERVLIHAAAGGVGQAAVQLARAAGAEVFATASPSKWDYLKTHGIRHVMNSRTVDFADQVRELTGGRGVDCVLNSLTGEFIPKSLEVLAEGGRFVELGKFGIWDEKQVHRYRPDVAYWNFDLAQISYQNPEQVASILDELSERFRQKTLEPIFHKVFPIDEAAAAFRFMAQAKHVGKVVLTHPSAGAASAPERAMIRSDGAYLITGGLGALGLQLAEWMVNKGARKLALIGRGGPSPAAEPSINRLEKMGASVAVVLADVSKRDDVERALEEAEKLGPLRGIVHAAGVLDDGILLNQDWQRFRKVMAPKMDGAWNLHALSRNRALDFFICYSSMASLLGSPGQGNYAAANAFLDALAHHRRAQGLPALSVNWGGWAGAGMAARMDSHTRAIWSSQGLGLITAEQGMDVLEQLWERDAIQVGVQPVNWAKLMRQFPVGFPPPLLEAFAHEAEATLFGQSKFIEALNTMPADERRSFLEDEVRAQIASVLGFASADEIELRSRLFDLGLDSLMALELKTRLERMLCCTLRPTLVFDYPTVEALVDYFAEESLAAHFAADGAPPTSAEAVWEAAASLDDESEDAIAEQLARELSDLEQARGK